MRLLALDIGTRRTGVAVGETVYGTIVALDTIHHRSTEELLAHVKALIAERSPEQLIVGLPKLPSGEEGSQAAYVREIAARIREEHDIDVRLVDERYTTQREAKKSGSDPDARAACQLLQIALEMENSREMRIDNYNN